MQPYTRDPLEDEAVERRAARLGVLHQAARELAATRSEQDVFDVLGRQALVLCGARAWAGLYDAATATMDFRVWLQDGARLTAWEGPRPAGTGLGGEVARTGLTIAASDYVAECRARGLSPSGPLPARQRYKMPWVGVPMPAGPGVVGVLCAFKRRGDAFDPGAIEVLETLAAHGATALANAALRAEDAVRRIELEARASELTASEHQLRALHDAMACGVVVLSAGWTVIRMNSAAEAILGWSFADLSGEKFRSVWDAVQEDGLPFVPYQGPVSMALRTGQQARRSVVGVRRRAGPRRWLQLDVVPVFHADGTPNLTVCTFVDVTERKLAEQALHESEARHRLLFERNPHPMWVVDTHTLAFLAVNESAIRHYGYTREEFLATTARFLRPADEVAGFVDEMTGPAGERRLARQWRHLKKDGTPIHVEVDSHRLIFDGRDARIAVVTDITERKRAEDALAHQALHDLLTDLPNRTLLHDRLRQAIRTAERDGTSVALLVMDLDRFKEVNDTFGHHYGDLLLRQVGDRLQGALRDADTLARLGGDEFALLLPVSDEVGAADVARRLLQALDEPFAIEGHNLDIGASIGIAVCPEHGGDADTLLQRADVAMYVAKRSGTGHAVYTPDQDQHSPNRLSLAGELRHAIEQDQLVLHYQPKLDLASRQVVGVEALVRWQHPGQGLVLPDQFIPLAEQSGLIHPLAEWVLGEAARQYHHWRLAGFDLPVAVNLSMRNLHDPRLSHTIANLLATWNLTAAALNLEITESSLMADPHRALEVLGRLRELGLSIAIDDFGTGYSSLAYLKRLPVAELKLDRSFVREMASDPRDLAIVRSTVDLAHNLGLRVVAEGVEDSASQELLAELACDQAQGYFISRPLPAAALTDWLRRRSPRPELSAA
jgi:diguanylate cyclase (GGDEF)-like protein/PAS domain S-box-containing protein